MSSIFDGCLQVRTTFKDLGEVDAVSESTVSCPNGDTVCECYGGDTGTSFGARPGEVRHGTEPGFIDLGKGIDTKPLAIEVNIVSNDQVSKIDVILEKF